MYANMPLMKAKRDEAAALGATAERLRLSNVAAVTVAAHCDNDMTSIAPRIKQGMTFPATQQCREEIEVMRYLENGRETPPAAEGNGESGREQRQLTAQVKEINLIPDTKALTTPLNIDHSGVKAQVIVEGATGLRSSTDYLAETEALRAHVAKIHERIAKARKGSSEDSSSNSTVLDSPNSQLPHSNEGEPSARYLWLSSQPTDGGHCKLDVGVQNHRSVGNRVHTTYKGNPWPRSVQPQLEALCQSCGFGSSRWYYADPECGVVTKEGAGDPFPIEFEKFRRDHHQVDDNDHVVEGERDIFRRKKYDENITLNKSLNNMICIILK